MDEKRFWDLISSTRPVSEPRGVKGPSDPSAEAHAGALAEALCELGPEEVAAFDQVFRRKMDDLYTSELWGVAYLLLGGCSDDCFEYFRAGVIGRGERAYRAALENPETLGMLVYEEDEEDLDGEMLLYVTSDVYEELTGDELPYDEESTELTGPEWDEDDLEDLYPRLAAVL